MGAQAFADLLRSLVDTRGRQMTIRADHPLGGDARRYASVYVNVINLPEGVGSAGGGAEAENNRISFWIRGFAGSDPHGEPPTGKVRIEQANSTLPRTHALRGRSAEPERIARYLAAFLNRVFAEVPPRFTHSQERKD